MIEKLKKQLNSSPTAYHVVDTVEKQLKAAGFVKLEASQRWKLKEGDCAYTVVDGSALVAFKIATKYYSYNIVASHTDSPSFKIKGNPCIDDGHYRTLSIEEYGKAIQYSWLDRPLSIAGRLIVKDKKNGALRSVLVNDKRRYVIPSLAIHLNRDANNGFKINVRKDLKPLCGMHDTKDFIENLFEKNPDYTICDYDLYLYSATEAFTFGYNDEFFCSPRLDNQTSVFASVEALINSKPQNIGIVFLADNEEVGSRTKQGAGATILKDVIKRINSALSYDKEQLKMALADSFMVSCDNSHALHPNNPELADDTNKNYMNSGVVIKYHANQSYTTDAFSAAIIKQIFSAADVKYQDFFNRSDLLSGSTLGAISSSQLSVRSVDIGLPQLGMHSAAETMGTSDYLALINGLEKFYASALISTPNGITIK